MRPKPKKSRPRRSSQSYSQRLSLSRAVPRSRHGPACCVAAVPAASKVSRARAGRKAWCSGSLAKMPKRDSEKRDSDRGRRQTGHGGAVAGAAAGTKDVPGKAPEVRQAGPGKWIVAIRPRHISRCACPPVGAKLGKDPQHGLADLGGDAGREAITRRTRRRRTACGGPATGGSSRSRSGKRQGPVMADRPPRLGLGSGVLVQGSSFRGPRSGVRVAMTLPGRQRRGEIAAMAVAAEDRGKRQRSPPTPSWPEPLRRRAPQSPAQVRSSGRRPRTCVRMGAHRGPCRRRSDLASLGPFGPWMLAKSFGRSPLVRRVDARAELPFDSPMETE